MRLTKMVVAFLALMLSFIFMGCNGNTTTQQAGRQDSLITDSNNNSLSSLIYDPALDPSKVAPGNVKIWHDTLGMKLFEITLKPGDSLPMLAHPDHAFYILEGGIVAFAPKGGERQVVEFKTGGGFINGPFTDAGKNIGKTTVRLLEVDVYRPRVK